MADNTWKKHIALEEAKARQTSHWDMDYLPWEQVEALYEALPPRRDIVSAPEHPEPDHPRKTGFLCMALGTGLLLLALAAARYLI
jgi:hypothetical protein